MMLEILHGHLDVSMPLGSSSATQHYHSAKTKVRQGRERRGEGREREERGKKGRESWVKGESEKEG